MVGGKSNFQPSATVVCHSWKAHAMRLPLSFLASLFWSPHPRPHRRPVEAPASAVFDDDVTDCA
jgi:hypothetical protein